MNVLYYDKNFPRSKLIKVCKVFEKKKLDVLILPKETDLLLDCDLNTLVAIKEKINEAINKKGVM